MIEGQRRWWALGALALAMLTIGLDTTVLNVAVPTLAVDLHASTGQLQWFGTAYTLVLAGLLLPAGMLGDRFGRKRLLLVALVVFGAASLGCAYSGSAAMLIAARALLGLGAAFMMPLSMAVLPVLFPDEKERARALTIWVTSTVLGLPLGPILGGWLLDTFWWGSVFLINVPLVAAGVVAVALFVPDSRSSRALPLDLLGVALSSAGLLGMTFGFIQAGQDGWSSAPTVTGVAGGAVLLMLFVAWQRRARHPLVDLSLFGRAAFTWGTFLSTLVSFAMFGLLFAMPQYFQAVGDADSLGTGLRLLPWIGGMLIGTRVAGVVAERAGTGVLIAVGFTALAAGLILGAGTGVHTGYGNAAVWMTLIGIGLGFAMPTSMAAAIGALDVDRSGAGSGLIQSLRQVGGTIGVAILGTVLSGGYRARVDTSSLPPAQAHAVRDSVSSGVATARRLGSGSLLDSVRLAFVHGLDTMLVVCAAISLLGAVLAVLFLPRRVTPADAYAAESTHELVG